MHVNFYQKTDKQRLHNTLSKIENSVLFLDYLEHYHFQFSHKKSSRVWNGGLGTQYRSDL